jgi:L-lactate dehydrogenase complex protein LldG
VSAREEVLARVRQALGGGAGEAVPVPRAYRQAGEAGGPELLERFAERVADYRATVHRAAADAVPEVVAAALADGLARRDALAGGRAGRPRIVVPPGFPRSWLARAGAEVVVDDGLDAAALDDCAGVVTAAAVAIAETGTIVLDASPDQGRRAISLVPDLHVCVVRADQVVAGVPDALARLTPARAQTWISGPSATSDIELDRVEGVHGPRTLEVVLVG